MQAFQRRETSGERNERRAKRASRLASLRRSYVSCRWNSPACRLRFSRFSDFFHLNLLNLIGPDSQHHIFSEGYDFKSRGHQKNLLWEKKKKKEKEKKRVSSNQLLWLFRIFGALSRTKLKKELRYHIWRRLRYKEFWFWFLTSMKILSWNERRWQFYLQLAT